MDRKGDGFGIQKGMVLASVGDGFASVGDGFASQRGWLCIVKGMVLASAGDGFASQGGWFWWARGRFFEVQRVGFGNREGSGVRIGGGCFCNRSVWFCHTSGMALEHAGARVAEIRRA